jgi:hypothetical protein
MTGRRVPLRKVATPSEAQPLWVKPGGMTAKLMKARADAVTRHVQTWERDALAQLKAAGATDTHARALIARAHERVAGDFDTTEELADALATEVGLNGGDLAVLFHAAEHRSAATETLRPQFPEEEPVGNPTAADPEAQLAALNRAATQTALADNTSFAKARAKLLKQRPEVYNDLERVSDEHSFAEHIDAAATVELRKLLDAGVPAAAAASRIATSNRDLATLTELARCYPAAAALPIAKAVARLRKARPEIDVLGMFTRVIAADAEEVVTVLAKKRQ